ncbi:metal ABC transporter solute-binding protein, Zn/Mn family [Ornithinibacillus halotolerans]|uniref:Adhesin n=1 Tax=Ornithinibacillus halotolerans TaxID=1274357 RepID=A0A916RZE1_9BACI|nr:zinc ABC transporter substrate-binding protein [Ornithinibacillus halotolerans]GGA76943.1 adhesin [Ornithinibacillus halotolerans]
MKLFTTIGLIIISGFLLIGCQSEQPSNPKPESKLSIYTSIYPIQYIIERIGGETIDTSTIFPPGVDAHSYEPTTRKMIQLAKSDAFVYMGAGMEGFSNSIANALESEHVHLLELGQYEDLFSENEHDEHYHSDEVDQHEHNDHNHSGDGDHHEHNDHNHSDDGDHHEHNDHNHSDEGNQHEHDGHNHGDHDPHIWIDPIRMIDMAEIILQFLLDINPSEMDLYERNFMALKEDLMNLDNDFKEMIEQKSQMKFLISHAAYGYWEERYGIKQLAINGVSSTSEPSQKDLVRIIEQAKNSELNYIIFEQNTSSKVSTIIKDYLQIETLTIHNLAVLTEDDIKNKEDYLTLMRKNLKVLDQALQ